MACKGRFPGGSVINHTGYACEASNLVTSWRAAFSAQPASTHPEAPFGLVTLAAGTSEGHGQEMPAFRQAQMGGFSHAPNPSMPGVFVAAAHDLGDPCYRGANCSGTQWDQYHAHSYMGPIHPRIKRLPAQRLATAAALTRNLPSRVTPSRFTGPRNDTRHARRPLPRSRLGTRRKTPPRAPPRWCTRRAWSCL